MNEQEKADLIAKANAMNSVDRRTLLDKIKMPRHPGWKVAELFTVGLILVAIFGISNLYKNPMEPKDLVPIATTLLTIAGFSIAKASIAE